MVTSKPLLLTLSNTGHTEQIIAFLFIHLLHIRKLLTLCLLLTTSFSHLRRIAFIPIPILISDVSRRSTSLKSQAKNRISEFPNYNSNIQQHYDGFFPSKSAFQDMSSCTLLEENYKSVNRLSKLDLEDAEI